MIRVREATEADVEQIRDVFRSTYGDDYAYPQYYDPQQLKKMIFDDDTLILVAEEIETGRIAGTASVLLQVGAYADLVGEFGRLAVHAEFRHRGIGRLLMQSRVERVQECLHLGLVENRVVHTFSQAISESQGFVPVGFLPMKTVFSYRESVALFARYFGVALSLRRNNPRVVPEAYRLADRVLRICNLPSDAIVDEESAAYPHDDRYELDELTSEGYAALLRFERGRIRQREVFGPMRLHYGRFKLRARRSNYLLARENGQVAGAVGFIVDDFEKTARVFEIVLRSDQPIRFLVTALIDKCRDVLGTELIEIDVNADAPRMQRTLLEFGFLPTAYIPAMVFHEVERLDAIKMCRLLVPFDVGRVELSDSARKIADIVIADFVRHEIQPRVARAIPDVPLFSGLNPEQARRLAAVCRVQSFKPGERIIEEGGTDRSVYVTLEGDVEVSVEKAGGPVATLAAGECLGETGVLSANPHSATATAKSHVVAARFQHRDLQELIRRRPDIGVIIYRNLALGIGEKLKRTVKSVSEHAAD